MSEPWIEVWNEHKDEAAEGAHIGWMEAKISHGFADHPFEPTPYFEDENGKTVQVGFDSKRCCVCVHRDDAYRSKDKHHPDMIPFADLKSEIKQYDYDTAIIGFRYGFEARNKQVKRLQEAVALLNSMVLCGESHSDTSRDAVRKALDARS